MSDNNKYKQPTITCEDIIKKLEGASPLQASKILIDVELHDQRSSLDVLNSINAEFKSSSKLLEPIFFNIIDSAIHHPKLSKYFKADKHNLTPSKIISELKGFSYDNDNSESKLANGYQQSNQGITHRSNRHNYYGSKDSYNKAKERGDEAKDYYNFRDKNKMDQYRGEFAENFDETRGKVVAEKTHVDHVIAGSKIHDSLASLPLSDQQLKNIINRDSNYAMMAGGDNISKSNSKTATQYANDIENKEGKKPYTKEQKKDLFINDVEALSSVALEAGFVAATNQIKSKSVGELILLALKPIWFELTDIFKNGIDFNLPTSGIAESVSYRFKRVYKYIKSNIWPFLKDSLKTFFDDLLTNIFTAITGLIVNLFFSAIKVITRGIKSIIEAIKIALSNDPNLSAAQKADAILKLLATTVTTMVVEHFENQLLGFISGTPLEPLKDILSIVVSGILSSIVVYLIDKMDLFSLDAKKRTQRIQQIFAMRVQQLKENTDAFEEASITKIAQDRLKFRTVSENMAKSIAANEDVNESVYKMADFMKIDLKIKSTDHFMDLLNKAEPLVVS